MDSGNRDEKKWVQGWNVGRWFDTRKKNQFRTEGGSIGEIPEEKLEFRGRKVVSGMKKTEFSDRRGFDPN